MPPALLRRPKLDEATELPWRCFSDLHRARLYGLVPMGIQTHEIVAWMDLYGVTNQDAKTALYELVCAVDAVWLEREDAKRNSDTNSRNRPNKSR